MNNIFIIASIGGCGSVMLYKYLSNYCETYHFHWMEPPKNIEDLNLNLSPNKKIIVLYIYRNPIEITLSRYYDKDRLKILNISDDIINMEFDNFLDDKNDLHCLEEIYDNHVNKSINNNYDIIAIKYEDFFDKQYEFKELLGLDDTVEFPQKNERTFAQKDIKTQHTEEYIKYKLSQKYFSLIEKMNNINFITIIKKSDKK